MELFCLFPDISLNHSMPVPASRRLLGKSRVTSLFQSVCNRIICRIVRDRQCVKVKAALIILFSAYYVQRLFRLDYTRLLHTVLRNSFTTFNSSKDQAQSSFPSSVFNDLLSPSRGSCNLCNLITEFCRAYNDRQDGHSPLFKASVRTKIYVCRFRRLSGF